MKGENLTSAVSGKLVLCPVWSMRDIFLSHSPITSTPSGALSCYFQNSFFAFPVLPMVSRVFVGPFLLTCTGIVCWAGVNLMHFSGIARDGGTHAVLDFFFYLNQTDLPLKEVLDS